MHIDLNFHFHLAQPLCTYANSTKIFRILLLFKLKQIPFKMILNITDVIEKMHPSLLKYKVFFKNRTFVYYLHKSVAISDIIFNFPMKCMNLIQFVWHNLVTIVWKFSKPWLSSSLNVILLFFIIRYRLNTMLIDVPWLLS